MRVANEAAVWKPAGAELDLPSVLCPFAKLKAVGRDDMLEVAAKKLSPMVGKMNDWGLCATLWSYQQLDTGIVFLTFRQRLESEVAQRQLLNEDVERSRLGPEERTRLEQLCGEHQQHLDSCQAQRERLQRDQVVAESALSGKVSETQSLEKVAAELQRQSREAEDALQAAARRPGGMIIICELTNQEEEQLFGP
ncbi:unnamed protein product [Effrenium voratum]|nr:unnamed protein product [Effrenium voratum]